MSEGGAGESLGEMAERLDAERFVGRAAEVDLVAAARAGTVPTRVVHLHGPGGVGKSAVLREVARRARADGDRVVRIDGRSVKPLPGDLAAALAPAAEGPCLLVLDEVDHLAGVRFELAAQLAATLAAGSVAVLAGRSRPPRGWADGELAGVAVTRSLTVLTHPEARELLRRGGPIDDREAEELVAWSGGFPLALVVALLSRSDDGSTPAGWSAGGRDLEAAVLERLGERELDGIEPDVVDVAAVAPAVDARLLAAVLPGRPTRHALEQLRGSSLTEQVGGRVTLHPLVRDAARSRLRDTDPDRYRTLVLAVTDHIHGRAIADGSWSPMDLTDMVEATPVRQGFGPSATHFADRPRPEDHDALAERFGGVGTAWFARFWRFCTEVPYAVPIVRRADGTPVGFAVSHAATAMPAWAADDIEVGPVLDHVAAAGHTDVALLVHLIKVVEDSPSAEAEAIRVGNLSLARTGGVANPRWVYCTVPRSDLGPVLAFGYEPVPELDRHDGERDLVTVVMDHGPGGYAGGVRSVIRAEQGVLGDDEESDRALVVVEALRSYRDDEALAASPLAPAPGPGGVEAVRRQVSEAVERAFGGSPADEELARALRRAYIDPDGGHAVARRELHMSRSAFYRHLQKARDRLARGAG